ncbi:hypothetical protein ACLOJK_028257 [Asimina triloba]
MPDVQVWMPAGSGDYRPFASSSYVRKVRSVGRIRDLGVDDSWEEPGDLEMDARKAAITLNDVIASVSSKDAKRSDAKEDEDIQEKTQYEERKEERKEEGKEEEKKVEKKK